MDLVIVGSVATDRLHLPSGVVHEAIGGSCVYAAIAATKFRIKVGIVGAIGGDERATKIVEFLSKFPIDLTGLERLDGQTFFWEGRYFEDMNQRETLSLSLGVFADFVPKIPDQYKSAKVLFLANISPQIQMELIQSVNADIVVLDTMDHWISSDKENLLSALKAVDLLIINDQEARLLGGSNSLIRSSNKIKEYLKGGNLIVKKGEHGSILFTPERMCFVPAYPLENPVDPTGAGDSFAGALLGAWLRLGLGRECLGAAMFYATATASFCVEGVGPTKLAECGLEEIEKRADVLNSLICRRWDSNPHVREDTWS